MTEKELLKDKYKLVLGLEIHLHLGTKKKMFCGCPAEIWEKEANSVTCPTCLGLPGALPVPNNEAIRKTQLLGLAFNCSINKNTWFDRKHYFYPDLPKGYQISQYKNPLCLGGYIELDSGVKAEIDHVHLEEDVAKSFHLKEKTLLDFNKSGIPLVEVVTKPIFTEIKDAVEFCKKTQTIVRYLGVGDVDMEKGQMRLEANISLRTPQMEKDGKLANYKVEIKNINSFKFMEKAVLAEIQRQVALFEDGETPIQENRGYDEDANITVSQRSKEEANDYRYFPDPDIPPMVFDDNYIAELKSELPELPSQLKEKIINTYKLPDAVALRLVYNLRPEIIKKFEGLVKSGLDATLVANTLINKKESHTLNEQDFKKFIGADKEIVSKEALGEAVKKVLENNKKAVLDLRGGKESVLMFLLGQVMKETKGNTDPSEAKESINKAVFG